MGLNFFLNVFKMFVYFFKSVFSLNVSFVMFVFMRFIVSTSLGGYFGLCGVFCVFVCGDDLILVFCIIFVLFIGCVVFFFFKIEFRYSFAGVYCVDAFGIGVFFSRVFFVRVCVVSLVFNCVCLVLFFDVFLFLFFFMCMCFFYFLVCFVVFFRAFRRRRIFVVSARVVFARFIVFLFGYFCVMFFVNFVILIVVCSIFLFGFCFVV